VKKIASENRLKMHVCVGSALSQS